MDSRFYMNLDRVLEGRIARLLSETPQAVCRALTGVTTTSPGRGGRIFTLDYALAS